MMSKKNKDLAIWLILGALTLGVYAFSNLDAGWQKLLPVVFAGISWNIYAYGVDKGMWPRRFIELDGYGMGRPMAREVIFWVTTAIYLMLLALLIFSY